MAQQFISQSIILRRWEVGEADLLVSFFSKDYGRLTGIARSALKSKRRFCNCLDIFSVSNLEFQYKKASDKVFLHRGKLEDGFAALRYDYNRVVLAAYAVRLIETLSPIIVKSPKMFEALLWHLYSLNKGCSGEYAKIAFDIYAMALGGFGINFEKCSVCGKKYNGNASVVFAPHTGGILCSACSNKFSYYPKLSAEAVPVIETIQKGFHMTGENIIYSEKILDELNATIKLHINYRIDKNPNFSRIAECGKKN